MWTKLTTKANSIQINAIISLHPAYIKLSLGTAHSAHYAAECIAINANTPMITEPPAPLSDRYNGF